MIFGGLLRRGTAFGKMLGNGAKAFGRNLSSEAEKISSGIGRAESKISNLEKKMGNVPIIGSGLKTIGSVLEGAKDVSDMTAGGGRALTNLARGDFKSVGQDVNSIKSSFGNLAVAGKNAMESGASAVAGASAFI